MKQALELLEAGEQPGGAAAMKKLLGGLSSKMLNATAVDKLSAALATFNQGLAGLK